MRAAVVEILFVAPEITPYSRTGSVGDVCAALPKALRGLGHRVTVVSPLYRGIEPVSHSLARRLSPVAVDVAGERTDVMIFDGRTTGGVEVVFVAHDAFATPEWNEREPSARARSAILFGAAAVEIARSRQPAVEVLHAHGWFAAPALAIAEKALPAVGRVCSLHDAGERAALDDASAAIPPAWRDTLTAGSPPNLLAAGARAAQRVIAGSQREASDLATRGASATLGPDAFAEGKLVGIADGLDAARWNPLTDSHLPGRFDPVNLEGKARCKDQAQLDRGLPVRADAPLITVFVEDASTNPAGVSLLASAAADALRNHLQVLVIGGAGVAMLAALAEKYPDRVALTPGVDEKLLHRALAASDFLLLPTPPRLETSVLLAALRYGALPIARRTGGAADALVDCDAKLETGTGFAFEREDSGEMADAITRAVAAYAQPERFLALRRKVMRLDLSWERSARRYEHVYKSVAARRD